VSVTYEIIDRATNPPTVIGAGLTEEQARSELKRLRDDAAQTNEVVVSTEAVEQAGGDVRILAGEQVDLRENPAAADPLSVAPTEEIKLTVPVVGHRGQPRQYDIRIDEDGPNDEEPLKFWRVLDLKTGEAVFETDDEDEMKAKFDEVMTDPEGESYGWVGDPALMQQWVVDGGYDVPEEIEVPPPKTPEEIAAELPEPPRIVDFTDPDDIELKKGETEREVKFKWKVEGGHPDHAFIYVGEDVRDSGAVEEGKVPTSWSDTFGPGLWLVSVVMQNAGGTTQSEIRAFNVWLHGTKPVDELADMRRRLEQLEQELSFSKDGD
jgi:hypothetical protein